MVNQAPLPDLKVVTSLPADADAVVLVGPPPFHAPALPRALQGCIESALAVDQALGIAGPSLIPITEGATRRLVVASTGPLNHFTDDVRRYADAAGQGIARAIAAGARRPALVVLPPVQGWTGQFSSATLCAMLGAMQPCWRNSQLHARRTAPIAALTLVDPELGPVPAEQLKTRIAALETAITLARDLTGGDPEFMAPEPFAKACEVFFENGPVRVTVDRDAEEIVRQYPLIGAVARASLSVERHHPRIVRLEYDGGAGQHLFLCGKGVTYDTGGADLKVNGAMAGMSKDKGGAAGVAGFFALLAAERPALRATALLGLVRNSIGADAFVSDEIIVSRGGVPVVIGNTDAEGRMVLTDLLAALLPEAKAAPDPVLMTLATLTGHVGRAYGPYPAVMGNGTAIARGCVQRIIDGGARLGDPFEHSMIRREDYEMIATKGPNGVMPQCNSLPSVQTPRGHQFPFCFLERTSGLQDHDLGSKRPIAFLHLDLSGAVVHKAGALAGHPSGCPVLALAAAFLELA